MINCIYWDALSVQSAASSESPRVLHAIFPSPVDSDQCFMDAGFNEFADTNDIWDGEWNQIIHLAITHLEKFGELSVRQSIAPVIKNALTDRILKRVPKFEEQALSVGDQIALATMDDQFGQCTVDFGENREVTLIANSGHPILWIFKKTRIALSIEEMAKTISLTHVCSKRSLNWPALNPPQFPG